MAKVQEAQSSRKLKRVQNARQRYRVRAMIEPYLDKLIKELLDIALTYNPETGQPLYNNRDRMRAISLLMDRCIGKPKQQVIVNGDEEGGPVRLDDSRLVLARILSKLIPREPIIIDGGIDKSATNGSGRPASVRLEPPGET